MIISDRLQNAITVKEMNGKIFVSCVQSVALYGIPKGEQQTHDTKLKASLCRSRNTVHEIAYCNDWDYFITITFDKQKTKDRYNVQGTLKELRNWLNNYKKRYAENLKYLLIPELHKDKAVHVHGLIKGLPENTLKKYSSYTEEEQKKYDFEKLAKADYYNWVAIEKKFGRNSLGKIKSAEGVSHYMTKYISKDMVSAVQEINLNTYYASKGLNRAKKLGIYDSTSIPVSCLKWDWQATTVDKETGELIETSTYKRTFDTRSAFEQWILINGIKMIKEQE